MSNYKVIKVIEEKQPSGAILFVALVEKKGEDQPFRVAIENTDNLDEVKLMLDSWVSSAEASDKQALLSAEEQREANARASKAFEINSMLGVEDESQNP